MLAVALRIAFMAIGVIARSPEGLSPALRRMWVVWDAQHYLRIAEVGYRSTGGEDPLFVVFFPLYPAVTRLGSFVVRDLLASALVVSLVATVGAAWFLYLLACEDGDHHAAWRSVLALFAFPTAYFLAMPYSEALFLLLVTGAAYAARRNRWPSAGAAAAASTATRLAGIAVLPALAVEAVRSARSWSGRAWRLGWAAVGVAGLVTYLAINLLVRGDALAFLDVQRSHWHQRAVPPWTPLIEAVRSLGGPGLGTDLQIVYYGRLGGFVLGATLLVAGVRRLRLTDQVYGWAGLLLVSSAAWLISLPRYLIGIYPLFIVLGRLTRRRALGIPLLVASFVLQGWFVWRYVQGRWTF